MDCAPVCFFGGYAGGYHCGLEKAVQALAAKYAVTYVELERQIQRSEAALVDMIDELTGSEFDMKGLSEFPIAAEG